MIKFRPMTRWEKVKYDAGRVVELLMWLVLATVVLTSPFACVYGCRAAWVAGGR